MLYEIGSSVRNENDNLDPLAYAVIIINDNNNIDILIVISYNNRSTPELYQFETIKDVMKRSIN